MAEEEKEKEHHEHEHKEEHAHNHEKEEHHEHEHGEEHVHHEHNEEHGHHEQEAEKAEKPAGEKKDLRDSRIAILVFTAAGALMGAISLLLKPIINSSYMIGFLGIVLDIIVLQGLGKVMKRKSKFLLAGFFIFLLVWLVAWIFLFNL